MIKIVNLEKVYYLKNKRTQKALINVNLELPDKGLVLICGKSGSGKTTLLNILGGLDYQTNGDIYVDDKRIEEKDLDSYRSNYSSFVFQDLNLIEEHDLRIKAQRNAGTVRRTGSTPCFPDTVSMHRPGR